MEEELNTSRQQLEEAKHLVAVLTEMLNEDGEEQDIDNEDKDVETATEKEDNDSDDNPEDTDNSSDDKATPTKQD